MLDAVKGLGFVPNALARNFARSKTDSIGVVVPGITNPYYAVMVETIDRTARESGLRTLLGLTAGDEARRELMIEDFLSGRADGLTICAGDADAIKANSWRAWHPRRLRVFAYVQSVVEFA